MKDSRVLEILQAIDSNTDGLVDFSEFVAATLHVHQLEEHNSEKWQQMSRAAFEKFDVDGDGFITSEELKMHTCLRGSTDPLLEEADIDKDGKISLSEFRRLLRTASMSSRNVTSSSVNRELTDTLYVLLWFSRGRGRGRGRLVTGRGCIIVLASVLS
ncbi:calcium-dependent kinase 28-like [Olea europaea subsp. europaea]|nr:calcium-dependent kinase 28-like [Olea europaea subsp. europaea]